MSEPIVTVDALAVDFPMRGRRGGKSIVHAVRDVSFHVMPHETLAIVGESGSGKSTTARAIVGLQKPTSGHVQWRGVDLATMNGRSLRAARQRLGMVFQDPYSSLDPSMRIEDIVEEPLRLHAHVSRREARHRARAMLREVGIHDDLAHRHPRALSGGQRQRVAIARAMILQPDLVVCDEAVSALDASTRNQVVTLLQGLQRRIGASYLFISHDLSVVRQIAHRVAVMYLGRIVEIGPADQLFEAPAHPYTQALMSAVPIANPRVQRSRTRIVLRGEIASALETPTGCAFHPRCAHAMERCAAESPSLRQLDDGREVACHLFDSAPPKRASSDDALEEADPSSVNVSVDTPGAADKDHLRPAR